LITQKKIITLKLNFNRLKNSFKFRFENKFYFEQWFLIFKFGKNSDLKLLSEYNQLIPPKDRFWADPHVIFKNNIYYIFFEEYIYKNKKGIISLIKMEKNGNYTKPVKILEEDYHLSYPFIFEYENQVYMIPETHSVKTIQIYRCTEFPEKWEFCKVILKNIDAVDSTLLYYNKKWWLFTGVKNEQNSDWGNLHIFYSDNPLSENWIPHQMNPIITSKRNSQPAGKIFFDENSLYRPAQTSTDKEYGREIIINKIETLNEKEYSEKEIERIKPWNKKIKGIHTVNFENEFTILDAKWKRKNMPKI
jgi:hypothetical protein